MSIAHHFLHTKKIVYLLDSFPVLSQTFVLQEILELQRQGLPLHIYSLFQPAFREAATGEWQADIPITYISQQSKFSLATMAIRYFFTKPGRFLHTTLQTLTHHPLRPGLSYLCYGIFVAEQLQHLPIAHIHAHFASGGASVAQIVHLLAAIPYSFMTHAYDIYLSQKSELVYKMSMAHFVATCSVYNQRYLQALVAPNSAERIHCLYCGLNLELFPQHTNIVSSVEAIPCILAVGRLVEKKGLLYLLLACKILKDQGYIFTCRIVGDGPQRSLLQQKLCELALDNHIEMIGSATHEQVIVLYQQATIVALPCIIAHDGDRDGIPNVLMEALYMEKAVVSTTVSGIPELIIDQQNGLLVPPQNGEALASALAQLLENPTLCHRLGQAGKETIKERFDVRKNAHHLATLFHENA